MLYVQDTKGDKTGIYTGLKSETVDNYTVKNNAGDEISIDGFDEEQFRVSLGAEIAKSFEFSSGATITPILGFTGGFSGVDGSGAFGQIIGG